MTDPDTQRDDPTLPAETAADLRRAFSGGPAVPGRVDDRMLAEARKRLSRPVIARIGWRRLAIPGVAAAMVLLFVWYAAPLIGPARQGPPSIQGWPVPGLAGEVRVSGPVDILAALRLAKAMQWGQSRPEWDINGDGRVDNVDVDALAMRAVSLGGAS